MHRGQSLSKFVMENALLESLLAGLHLARIPGSRRPHPLPLLHPMERGLGGGESAGQISQLKCILEMCVRCSLAGGALLTSCAGSLAEDWPQFRGPRGDGVSTEKILWPANGPKRLWKVNTPGGFSS